MAEKNRIEPTVEEDESFFSDPRFAWRIDKKVAGKLGRDEIGFLVETYYELQKCRIRASNRARALEESAEPAAMSRFYEGQFALMESRTKALLMAWCKLDPVSNWAIQIRGIGPVIAAGIAAHFRIEKAPSISSFWRFAGMDPTSVWGKGEKRPWNAALKVLVWKAGQSFVKLGVRYPDSLYARVYREAKADQIAKNEAGSFKDQAVATLEAKKFTRDTTTKTAYEAGRLPDGRIELRAERKATKLFLAHYWERAFRQAHPGKDVPAPWAIAHGGHVHKIEPEIPWEK